MAKVQGSYKSIIRGVSQQHPDDRLEGQCGDQVNMLSDPVRGLVRRQGSVLLAQTASELGEADTSALLQDACSRRTHSWQSGGRYFDLLYRSREKPTGSPLDGLVCFEKTQGSSAFREVVSDPLDTLLGTFLDGGFSAVTQYNDLTLLAGNSVLPSVTASDGYGGDTNQRASGVWVKGGTYSRTYTVRARKASTATFYEASYTTPAAAYPDVLDTSDVLQYVPNYQQTSNGPSDTSSSHTLVADGEFTFTMSDDMSNLSTVAGSGGYNLALGYIARMYAYVSGSEDRTKYVDVEIKGWSATTLTVKVRRIVGASTTVGGTNKLRLWPHDENTAYQKEINDRTYAYNVAVNAWIASSAEAIVPGNIAQQLADALNAAGFTGWLVVNSQLYNADCDSVEAYDQSGDLVVALSNTVTSTDDLTPEFAIGKIVRIDPVSNGEDSYYVRADSKEAGYASGVRKVIWRETAGVTQTLSDFLAVGKFLNDKFYVASSFAALAALLLAEEAYTLTLNDLGTWPSSLSGDLTTNPPPHFIGRQITALSVFQNRLVVCSGSTVNMSRINDPFQFWRTTVVTLPDDDPIEGYAVGSEDDVIRQAATYDRNLYLYADSAQFVVNGRVAQTPATFSMGVSLRIDNTGYAKPVGSGPLMFFLKEDQQLGASRLLQVQAGVFQDQPAVHDVSQQLRDYINGTPAEIVCLSDPSIVAVRTEFIMKSAGGFGFARPWGLFVYQYLDQPDGQRVTDAWSAWEWSSALGACTGISRAPSGDAFVVYTSVAGTVGGVLSHGTLAMHFPCRASATGLPHLDGLQGADAAEQASCYWGPHAGAATLGSVYTAFGAAYSTVYPGVSDSSRFAGIPDYNYTIGDGPAEEADPLRWRGWQGYLSDASAGLGDDYPLMAGKELDAWTGLAYPAYIDTTNPQVRDRNGEAIRLGQLVLTKLRVTTTQSAGFAASWRDHDGTKELGGWSGAYYRDRVETVWIGRGSQDVQVRLAADSWLPLTISGIEWQGQWFHRSGRI